LEDELRLATTWQLAIEQKGYAVIVESSFDAASRALQESEIALVISDMLIRNSAKTLAPKGGLSLLAFINLHLDREKRPPVIVVTGADASMNIDKHAETLKATLVLTKPVSTDELVDRVCEVLDHESH
jgi:DNA-binding response OmpR family regulator